jgi:hypothetical protein
MGYGCDCTCVWCMLWRWGENARLTQPCARLARRAWRTRCSSARPRMRRRMRTWSRGCRSTSTGRRSRAPRAACACCRRTLPRSGCHRRDAAHAASARLHATQPCVYVLTGLIRATPQNRRVLKWEPVCTVYLPMRLLQQVHMRLPAPAGGGRCKACQYLAPRLDHKLSPFSIGRKHAW